MEALRRPFQTPSIRTRRRATSLGTSRLTTIESPDLPSTLRRMLAHVRHVVTINRQDHVQPSLLEDKSNTMADEIMPAMPVLEMSDPDKMDVDIETRKDSAAEVVVGTSSKIAADPKPAEERRHCSICSDEHPRSALANPCKVLDECLWCGECLQRAFISAAADEESMPPRCHTMIQLHYALPHISQEHAATYRKTFDVWSTKKRVYCPVPTCSAFIPPRYFDAVEAKDGTTVNQLHCPKCETALCNSCHNVAHGDQPCAEDDIDPETLAALTRWGYKRCPKCKEGVRRMYGCTHMRCRCGVSWCWNCQQPIDECERSQCDYEDEVADDDDEEDFEDEDVLLETLEAGAELRSLFYPTDPTDERPEAPSDPAPEPVRHVRRQRSNLDARPAHYWESQDLDFGDEPNSGIADGVWCCEHNWQPYDLEKEEKSKVEVVECHRCWKACKPMDLADTPEAGARQCNRCWVAYCVDCALRCTKTNEL